MNFLAIHFENICGQADDSEECVVCWWKSASSRSKENIAILLSEIRQIQMGVLQRPGPAITMYFKNQSAAGLRATKSAREACAHLLTKSI